VGKKYTGEDFCDLFEAAGLGQSRLCIPLRLKDPFLQLSYKLIPGEYFVEHIGNNIILPPEAIEYYFNG
jgi:hypothetical protein